MGEPELINNEKYFDSTARLKNQEDLDEIIAQWTRDKDYYEVTKLLQKVGVASAPSLSSEGLFHDPHLREREVYSQLDHPCIGKDSGDCPPPGAFRKLRPGYTGIPRFWGSTMKEIFAHRLGLSPKEIDELEKEEVIY